MMKTMQKTVLALAVLATTSLPVMAAGVDVRVIGTIAPAACTPTLTGGGTIDYGVINPASLSNTAFNVLSEKQIDLSITCDAPAKLAIKAINGRPSTMAGTTEGASGAGRFPDGVAIFGVTAISGAGLGMDGADKIGGYGIRIVPGSGMADSVAVDSVIRHTNYSDTSWKSSSTGVLYDSNFNRELTWTAAGTVVPVAFENLNAKVGVQAYLNKASELDLTKPVALDGLTTLELVYL